MNKPIFPLLLLGLFLLFINSNINAQGSLLYKIKNKAEDKVVDKIFNEKENKPANNSTPTSSSKTENNKGGGLSNTAPDVKENIAAAKTAYAASNFSDARYSTRQAIMGIELEIGQNILKSLPDKADGLPKDPEDDQVTSSGVGFVGLLIQRAYREKDKELKIVIQNDAAMFSAVNMYLGNGGYASSSNNQNHKQTKFKGYPAVIQYEESSGYTLSVPFGQSSIAVISGVNYSNENTFTAAANEFDIEKIKKELGEK